ncbi:MAG: alpha/beta fold hydrolase [Chloroflexi bacterium]|nr:alpha/beta fold hydrolase [Chloroflexota bacterium]
MRLEVISRQPTGPAHAAPLLFVHGLWTGVWCWTEHFMDYFAAKGYAVHALSLRGHGQSEGRERLRWTRLADYVADVAQVAGQLPAAPILVGHSNGGAVVQKYLETRSAPAAVLMASVPPAGALPTALRMAARHPWPFLKSNLTLSLYPIVATSELARDGFFSADMPEEQVRAYQARMSDESFAAFLDILALNLPDSRKIKTPMLVMGGASDNVFRPSQVESTARAYGTQAVIFPGIAHGMMLEAGWQAVAERISEWLASRDL